MSGPTSWGSWASRGRFGRIDVHLLDRKRAEKWAREIAESMLRDGELLEYLGSPYPKVFQYRARGGGELMDAIKQLASDRRTRDRIEGRRDGLILEARLAGETWPVIANAVGLTELATRNAAKRANGGVLPEVCDPA